jgi:hypothetical protein
MSANAPRLGFNGNATSANFCSLAPHPTQKGRRFGLANPKYITPHPDI